MTRVEYVYKYTNTDTFTYKIACMSNSFPRVQGAQPCHNMNTIIKIYFNMLI